MVTAAALSVALIGCHGKARPAATNTAPVPVETVTVDPTATRSSIRYPATIVRDREANLSLRVGGVMEAIPLRIGDRLDKGQVVGKLDATPYRTARVRAEADVARPVRAARRNEELAPAGATSESNREDTASALIAAQAALESARYDEGSAISRSPFSGVVLSRDVEVGETVSPGQRIARVADLSSPLIARAAVPRSVGRILHSGMTALLVIDTDSEPLYAQVRHVGAAAGPQTATVDIELVIESNQPIASGTVGSVVFAGLSDRTSSAQILPAEALLDTSDGWGHVFVVDPATFVAQRTKVRLLGFDGDALRVEGVPVGARVITAGAGFVADGQKVTVTAP
jgi:RND family efflux transporter MFP subunit